MRKFMAAFILAAFIANTCVPYAHALELRDLPAIGMRVELSPPFMAPLLKGVKIYPDDPFRLDFILDRGDDAASRDAAARLIKYFLASLTVPEEDLWVNLSPYEKDRIVPEAFGQTEMGRDLLAQDYILKQITSSLLYPDGKEGRAFWARIYEEAQARFGTTDIPVDTFNKVWIVPEKATVFENKDAAFVVDSRLKVLLESDYLAMSYNALPTGGHVAPQGNVSPSPLPSDSVLNVNPTQALTQEVLRQVIIPVLEREVNEGRHFAPLRQVYHSLILATWFKDKIRPTLLSQAYVDRNKVAGVDIEDKAEREKIWARYVEAFRKGVFDLVREEHDPAVGEVVPRKYFSGGAGLQIKARGVYGVTDEPSRLPADFSMDNADIIAFEAEPVAPRGAVQGVRVLYDALGEHDVIGFSKFKYGAGEITRRFGYDLSLKVRREFGEEILRDPGNWAVVSVGGSRFLGECVARELGLYFAYVSFHVPNLLNVSNYAAAADVGSRLDIINSREFVLKNAAGLKAKKVILIDDLLNRGITLGKTRDFLERKHGLDVAATYVLFSLADREDPSLESRMNTALVDAQGMESLIRMVNGEDIFVTRHLLKRLLYEQDRIRNFLALDPDKQGKVLYAAFGHVLASVSALVRVKAAMVSRKVRGRPLDLVFRAVIKGQRAVTGIYERSLLSHLGSLSRSIENAVVAEGDGAVARIPVVTEGREESIPFSRGRTFGAVLLDYDGVLKSPWERVPSREIMDILVDLISRGYHVGIASGRTMKDLEKVLQGLRQRIPDLSTAGSLYVFEQNGAYGYRPSDGKVIVPHKAMDQQDRALILREIGAMTGVPSTWVGRRVYSSGAKVTVTVVSARERQRFARELEEKIGGWGCKERYQVFDTGEGVDIVPADVNKGAAADAFAEALGMAQDDILKIGDMYGPLGNDQPMLRKPGGVGVDSPAATAWLLNRLFGPALPPVDRAEARAQVNMDWFRGAREMAGLDTASFLEKVYTKDPDAPLRILDLGSDGQFLQELVTERWRGKVEAYALDIEKLRRLDLDVKDEIDGTEVFGLTDVDEGDPADIVAKHAGSLKFNVIFMNAPDPDGNNIRDYVGEAAAFSAGNTLVMLRLTRMDQRHLGAFAAAFNRRGFEYLGALNRPPADYPLTDFINGDENDRMIYFFSDQDAAEATEDEQVLRASELFFDAGNTARVRGLLDRSRGRIEALFGGRIARHPSALIDRVRVVVSPNTPAFARTLADGPFGSAPVIVINALPVMDMNEAQLLYLVGHELGHLVFDEMHARADALLRSTGDLDRNRAILAEIERHCDRLGLALAMDAFGPGAVAGIAQVPVLRRKYGGEIARLQKKYDLDRPAIFDPHMNDDERAQWLEEMIGRYAKAFSDGLDPRELEDILVGFPDQAMRSFTDEERRKIVGTLSYLQDVARAVQAEIEGEEWAGLLEALRQWTAENGEKTDAELAREPGRIDGVLATGEALLLKFKRVVDIVKGFKEGAEGLVTFSKSGQIVENRAVTGEDLLYDLQNKMRKLDHVLGMSIDWIDMLRQAASADVPAIAFRVRMIGEHVDEVLRSYREMLSHILHPEAMGDSYLGMQEDFSRESKGLPERIYTRFLLPARDVILPDQGTSDMSEQTVIRAVNEENPGGIDLDARKVPLEVRTGGEGLHFSFDAAAAGRFLDAAGIAPVIIDIRPMTMPLPKFLGLSDNTPALSH